MRIDRADDTPIRFATSLQLTTRRLEQGIRTPPSPPTGPWQLRMRAHCNMKRRAFDSRIAAAPLVRSAARRTQPAPVHPRTATPGIRHRSRRRTSPRVPRRGPSCSQTKPSNSPNGCRTETPSSQYTAGSRIASPAPSRIPWQQLVRCLEAQPWQSSPSVSHNRDSISHA